MSQGTEIALTTNAGIVAEGLAELLALIKGVKIAPLTLSGMTRGARKRAALWDVFVPWCKKEYGHDPSKNDPRAERRHMYGCLINRELHDRYLARRQAYGLAGVRIALGVVARPPQDEEIVVIRQIG